MNWNDLRTERGSCRDRLVPQSTIDGSSCSSSTSIPATLGHGLRKWLSEHESRNTLKFTANLAFHLYSRQPRTQPRALIRELPPALSLSFIPPLSLSPPLTYVAVIYLPCPSLSPHPYSVLLSRHIRLRVRDAL